MRLNRNIDAVTLARLSRSRVQSSARQGVSARYAGDTRVRAVWP